MDHNEDVTTHMRAMEGMLKSCIDRGVIDKKSAKAAIKRSKELRKQLSDAQQLGYWAEYKRKIEEHKRTKGVLPKGVLLADKS